MTQKKEFDFAAKKPESEWLKSCDEFVLAAVPKIFEWMRWVLTLGLFVYLSAHTHHWAFIIISIAGWSLLFLYYCSYFAQFEFKNIPFIGNEKQKVASITLSLAVAYITYSVITQAIIAVAENKP